ncbi:DUF4440 domain-containing protein [Dactylosporangium sp. NPDC049742]|uniref:DUF4440 domain-containing protein n=1 Tax=Dactylosporangium sp. NPDC049742 TaxID=3154737 RepID=UPI003448125C
MATDRADLLRELNGDVWQPLRAAYAARDAEAFLALHAPDLIRASATNHTIFGLERYAAQVRPWFAGLAARGDLVEITFRFTERLVSADLAGERGVFRIVLQPIGGDRMVLYARFHTLSRKVDLRWRIAVDYDTNDGGSVDAKAFDAAVAEGDVERFTG